MKKLLILLLSISISASQLSAAFKDPGQGVRPLGMGGAFTAVANDTNANIYNPAGVALPQDNELSFSSARLFTGLEGVDIGTNFLSYIHRVSDKTGNFGISWNQLYAQSIYIEDTMSVSYGRFMSDVIQPKTFDLLAGASIKYLRHEYIMDVRTDKDPVFANSTSKGVPTLDLGFMAVFPDSGLNLGLAFRNTTSPDVGLRTTDIVPMETAFGVAYFKDTMPYVCLPECTLALDIVSRDKTLDYRFGAETWVMRGNLCLRTGFNPQEITFGMAHEFAFSGDNFLEVDYAFSLPLQIEKSTGSHRLGLTFRFP